jgi:hypothetical protein
MMANTIPCFITQDNPAFRRELFDRIGGWTMTRRGDFDQQLIAQQTAIEAPGDPCRLDSPSWIFRWGQTPEQLNQQGSGRTFEPMAYQACRTDC